MQELLKRIESFDIDGGPCASTYAMRLAKEQEWTPEYTARVITEYKRFLFLGATQGPLTPSEVIDEAWHLHMIYTESYWTRLCGEVLGKPFHHHPSKGGEVEDTKHRNQFGDTRRKYLEAFGQEPPADIWGGRKAKPVAPPVDANTYWIVERKAANRWFLVAAGLATAAVIAAGCMEDGVSTGVGVVVCLAPIVLIAIVGTAIGRAMQNKNRNMGRGGGSGFGTGCSSSHMGYGNHFVDSTHNNNDDDSGSHHSSHSGHDTSAGIGHHGDAWGGDSHGGHDGGGHDSGSSDSGGSDSGGGDSGGSSCGSSCGGGCGGGGD